ncbi:trypsin-1-like [Oratosquilla oratoria]|uniref:trypsin-1-like n=1 Tax=Oratosquilla oratoria TaxID=337810 RepID=UPI003F75EDF5
MKALIFSLLVAGAFAATASRTHHSKISGGADPVEPTYDYFVSLKNGTSEYFCGGTVYNKDYIITSAQCVSSYPEEPTYLKVVTWKKGSTERDTVTDNSVKEIIVHEQYGHWTRSHDIALLHLTTPLVLAGDFKGIALESGEAKDPCTVTGLPGPTSKDVVNPDVNQAEVSIITDDKCREDYKPTQILHSMICAKGSDSSHVQVGLSDYGGPLVCNGKLAGVMSWGKEYDDSAFPEVYTEISYFDDWIKQKAVPPV